MDKPASRRAAGRKLKEQERGTWPPALASRANLAFRVGSCAVSPVSFHGFLLRPRDAGVWFLWATWSRWTRDHGCWCEELGRVEPGSLAEIPERTPLRLRNQVMGVVSSSACVAVGPL